ncbi:MAG: homocysteine S-methyltransferase family protein [Xanthomonadales bacterium]|nr:homocysteine S-methyltransferase family protein [Xanthomonadales bacterium]
MRAFGAYANGFSEIGAEFDGANIPDRRKELAPAHYAEHPQRWPDAGAAIVGDCCEVGTTHIAVLRGIV